MLTIPTPAPSPAAGGKPRIYKWIRDIGVPGGRLYDVGILPDGALHNPRGYPEHLVRAAVEAADERRRKKRGEAARKAAATRAARRERKVAGVVTKLKDGAALTASDSCVICGRHLTDPKSIERGIGSDCWRDILSHIAGAA